MQACVKPHELVHTENVSSLAWSPDGSKLVIGMFTNSAWIWDIGLRKVTHNLKGHLGNVWSVAWSPDGDKVVTGAGERSQDGKTDHCVRVWDVARGILLHAIQSKCSIEFLSWHLSGLAFPCCDAKVVVWNMARNKQKFVLAHDHDVLAAAWSPDGSCIATASADCSIPITHVPSMRSHAHRTQEPVNSIVWSGKLLVLAQTNANIIIKDVAHIVHQLKVG